jgi:hypothetical protein
VRLAQLVQRLLVLPEQALPAAPCTSAVECDEILFLQGETVVRPAL